MTITACRRCGGSLPPGSRRDRKWCSRRCKDGRGQPPDRFCACCGQEIPRERNLGIRFCSQTCCRTYHRRKWRQRLRAAQPPAVRSCMRCGIDFEPARKDAFYCSRRCKRLTRVCQSCGTPASEGAVFCNPCLRREQRPGGMAHRLKYDDEELLAAIRQVARFLGHTPSRREFTDRTPGPIAWTVAKRFGTWTQAVAIAGLEPRGGTTATPAQYRRYRKDRQMVTGLFGDRGPTRIVHVQAGDGHGAIR